MAHKKPAIPDIRRANKSQVAEFFDVSLPTVEAWIRKGCPVAERGARGISWVMDLRAVAQWLYQAEQSNTPRDPDSLPPQDRKAWYDAEARKRDLAEKAKELLPRAEVEQAAATAFAAVTQDLLAVSDQLERLHAVPPDIAGKVDAAICAALESLRERVGRLTPGGIAE